MPLTLSLPFAEERLVAYLKAYSALSALVSTRVSTRLPPSPTFPSVRLQRVGGIPDRFGVDQPTIQFDCYGRTHQEAEAVAAVVFKAVVELPYVQQVHGDTVFESADPTTPKVMIPDPDINDANGNPLPRVLFGINFIARRTA